MTPCQWGCPCQGAGERETPASAAPVDGAGIVPPEQTMVCGNKRSGVSRGSARLHPLLPGGLRAAQAQTPGAAPDPSARSPTPHPGEFRASSKTLACGNLSRTRCCERATRLSPGPCTSQGTQRAGGEHRPPNTHTHPVSQQPQHMWHCRSAPSPHPSLWGRMEPPVPSQPPGNRPSLPTGPVQRQSWLGFSPGPGAALGRPRLFARVN